MFWWEYLKIRERKYETDRNNYLINNFATYLLVWCYRPTCIKSPRFPGFEVLRETFVTTRWAGLPFYSQENNVRIIELEKLIQASHIRGMGRRKIKYSLLIGRFEEKRAFKWRRCYSQYDMEMYLKGMRWKIKMAKGFLRHKMAHFVGQLVAYVNMATN